MGFLEMAMERDHMGWEVQFLWQSWWFRGANVYGQSIASSHGLGGSKQKCEHILVHYIYIPIGSMYGIYANIGGILMVNVTIYGIHGSYGIYEMENKKMFETTNQITWWSTTDTDWFMDDGGKPLFINQVGPGGTSMAARCHDRYDSNETLRPSAKLPSGKRLQKTMERSTIFNG